MDKIVCIGKNYDEHAKEMAARGDAIPAKPALFLKPPSVLVQAGATTLDVPFPNHVQSEVHPECEIVLRLNRGGFRLSVQEAASRIEAITLGLDMTLRDLQADLKKQGQPWEIAKVFPASAICGPWIPASSFPEYHETPFSFSVDGKLRQQGNAKAMRLSPAECIAHASNHFELMTGDLIFTGTPAGIAAVHSGQTGKLEWGNRLSYSVRWI